MSESIRDRTLRIITDLHDKLAAFARTSYESDGRGVIHVGFPNVPPGHTAMAVSTMKYVTLDELQGLLGKKVDEDAAVLVTMIETYEPTKQAVVMAAIDGENPVSIKMKLELPTVVDEADGVH